MIVKKSGRTTEVTEGRVASVSVTTTYSLFGCGSAKFINQIIVKPTCSKNPSFSKGGDSGAPVVDENNNPVGIVVANNNAPCVLATTTVTPIESIMNALSFTLK
jgi:hypothetical protein